jgi:hypothetical protein
VGAGIIFEFTIFKVEKSNVHWQTEMKKDITKKEFSLI